MKKSDDNPDMKILATATCKTLSGKSTLSYQIGLSPESIVHLRISKNSGGGFFSDDSFVSRVAMARCSCDGRWSRRNVRAS